MTAKTWRPATRLDYLLVLRALARLADLDRMDARRAAELIVERDRDLFPNAPPLQVGAIEALVREARALKPS